MSEHKPARSPLERRLKALEEYLGLVFKESDDGYDDYIPDEYGFVPSLKKDVEKIKQKNNIDQKKKSFWGN
jgi:hypothetical protein